MCVEVHVRGELPLQGTALSFFNPNHPHYERAQKLVNAGKEAMRGRALLKGSLMMEMEYTGLFEFADPVNALCAVPNLLQGIVYADDNQIREVHFREKPGDEPGCVIRFKEAGS